MDRPICQKKDCDNTAAIFVNTKMVCAQCFVKIQEKRDKLIEELLEDDE